MDPTPHAFPLLNDSELTELREGTDRNPSFRRLHSRCLAYVLDYRQYRHLLSVDDGEEIVSQALVEELRFLKDSGISAEEVSTRIKRALNRVRARYVRERRRHANTLPAPIADADLLRAIQYRQMARKLDRFIILAIDALKDRDRDLLIDIYGLECHGLVKRGPSPVFATAGAHKVSLWRARQRFFRELQRMTEEASQLQQNFELMRGLHLLIKSGTLRVRLPGRGRRLPGEPAALLAL
jgi:uncharacterized protein YjiS (DUF1127 family)